MKLDSSRLKFMYDELQSASKIYYPSSFWDSLGKKHFEQLKTKDLRNFKRTVNRRYFNWGILGILRHQLKIIFSELFSGNTAPLFESRYTDRGHNDLHLFGQTLYRIFVASLYEHLLKTDRMNLLKKIEEPRFGNPYLVGYKNLKISQDLCNSIHEFYSIVNSAKLKKNASIAELGAGYGRTAYIFLKSLPGISYTVIDIPPALHLSEVYLSRVFSKEKIFKFRHFDKFSDIKKEYKAAKIRFLTPNQIELLPQGMFDLIINISSLHEMSTPQIKNYLKLISKIGRGYFYTKQWIRSRVRDNQHITEDQYPIPRKWKIIFKHHHPVQKMFFEALYQVKK